MNPRNRFNRNTSLALAAAVAVGIAACEDLTDPKEHRVGDPAPEVSLDLASAGGVPRGPLAIESFRLIVDTVGQTDVFQREGADGYYSSTYIRYYVIRGVRIAGQDPRLPALAPVHSPEDFSTTSWSQIWGPERQRGLIWDLWMRWEGLEPNQMYTYAIARLATHVNGTLDQMEYLIDGYVTEPDSLAPLDGLPGGYPDNDYSWTDVAGCALEPIPDPPPNPWYLGRMTATSTGRIDADYCMGTPWFWYTGTVNVPDSSIVAPNELRRGVVPQYNYIVVYEGEPPNLGPPVIRIQLGVDLDPSGNPIPNSFAPFPIVEDQEAALALPHVEAAPSRIALEIRDLEPLDAGTPYELWLVNAETGNSVSATADYFTIETIIVTDEFGQQTEVDVPSEDTVRTASFAGVSESNVRHAFIVSNRTLEGDVTVGEFTHVVVPRPGTAGAATDPVMWAQFLDQSGTPADPADDIFISADDFKFGALDLADPYGSRTFRASGSGEGLIWENELGLVFRRLRRPPPGYVYEVWLVDEAGNATSVGTIAGPKPGYEDIDDADTVVHDPFMTENEILEAAKLVPLEGIDLSQYVGVRLTLEPKAGMATVGPTTTLSGGLPATGSQ